MPKPIRRFAPSAAALLAASLWTPASAMQAAPAPDKVELLRAAHDEFLNCGQTAAQAKGAPPASLAEAKSLLGTNCMTEFNLVMTLAEAMVQRRISIEEVNREFDFIATLIVAPAEAGPATFAKDGAALPASAASARQPAPQSCKGSVKKGLKAYRTGSFETALCHWLPKARAGDAAAQNNIGLLFERGLTAQTPQSDQEAAAWFRLAAEQGLTMAMRNLAGAQSRLGKEDEGRAWIELADSTDVQNRLLREQQRAQVLAALAAGIACAVGGCAAPAPAYGPAQPRTAYGGSGSSAARPFQILDPDESLGTRRAGRIGTGGIGTGRIGPPESPGPTSGRRLCPDGSYVSGSRCHQAPDGTYLGGRPRAAPDGSYVEQGNVRLTPNGNYLGGTGPMTRCPDGTYVRGERCRLTPAGTYIGQ